MRKSVTAVECGGEGGSALASRLLESEHIACSITRSKTDPLCRKVTGPVWRRCAQIARSAYWRVLLASPRLKDLESFSVKMRL